MPLICFFYQIRTLCLTLLLFALFRWSTYWSVCRTSIREFPSEPSKASCPKFPVSSQVSWLDFETIDVSQFRGIPWYSVSRNYGRPFLTQFYNCKTQETTVGFGMPRNWEMSNIVLSVLEILVYHSTGKLLEHHPGMCTICYGLPPQNLLKLMLWSTTYHKALMKNISGGPFI